MANGNVAFGKIIKTALDTLITPIIECIKVRCEVVIPKQQMPNRVKSPIKILCTLL